MTFTSCHGHGPTRNVLDLKEGFPPHASHVVAEQLMEIMEPKDRASRGLARRHVTCKIPSLLPCIPSCFSQVGHARGQVQSRAFNKSRPCATWANPKRYEERTKVHKLCELGNGSWNKACSEQGRRTGGSIVSGLLTAHDAASSGKPSPFGNTWLLQLLKGTPCKTWAVCATRIRQWGRGSQECGFSAYHRRNVSCRNCCNAY